MSAQVAADLRAAADVLERDGWTQEEYHSGSGCHCVQGALAVAVANMSWVNPEILRRQEDDRAAARWDAANDILRYTVGGFNTSDWNDTPGRTAEQVVTALRAAADAADAAEVSQ